jgi:regulator of protease activity HflC (stomatin/prohibitin superfamily)
MISPGYIGIVVNLFGDDKGVAIRELEVGMHWIAPWKKVYTFPIFQQNTVWEGQKGFEFQSGEGLNVSAEIGLSYHLEPGKIHLLFAKYRNGLDEITNRFVRLYTRDAINKLASKMTVEQLYGPEKESFITGVQEVVRLEMEKVGIIIDRIYIIGTLYFPDQVVKALNSKIEATQRAQQRENELREAKAQAEKQIAAANGEAQSRLLRAEAEATSNRMIQQSLTPELLTYEAIQKWDGKLPQVVASGNVNPIMDMRSLHGSVAQR